MFLDIDPISGVCLLSANRLSLVLANRFIDIFWVWVRGYRHRYDKLIPGVLGSAVGGKELLLGTACRYLKKSKFLVVSEREAPQWVVATVIRICRSPSRAAV